VLIRHAKAEKDIVGKDINRPLKYIGIQDARFMAERLKEQKYAPEIFITSPALRTMTTAEIFADFFHLPDPEINTLIYEASVANLVTVINNIPENYQFAGIVGHNPGIAQIIDYLTGELKEVHTSTVAIIDIDADNWAEVSQHSGKLVHYSSPKE